MNAPANIPTSRSTLLAASLAAPMAIRDITVWGTVVAGRKFPVTDIKRLAQAPHVTPIPDATPEQATAWLGVFAHDRPGALPSFLRTTGAAFDANALTAHANTCAMGFWRTAGPLLALRPLVRMPQTR